MWTIDTRWRFITYELNLAQTRRNGGGSIMVAGGGLDEVPPRPTSPKSQPMFECADSNDGSETYPQAWRRARR